MSSAFDEELRRRFATQDPVPGDEAFVSRVGASVLRQRRRHNLLAVLGTAAVVLVAAFVLIWLAPLLELALRAVAALGDLAATAPSSPAAMAVLGAVAFAAAVVARALRRI